jgi:hypothetical protein
MVINTIYFANISPLSFKDNHILGCTNIIDINIILSLITFGFYIRSLVIQTAFHKFNNCFYYVTLQYLRCENNLHVSKELFRLLIIYILQTVKGAILVI